MLQPSQVPVCLAVTVRAVRMASTPAFFILNSPSFLVTANHFYCLKMYMKTDHKESHLSYYQAHFPQKPFSFLIQTYHFFAADVAAAGFGGFPAKLFLLGVIRGLSGGTPMVSMMILTECILPRSASLSTLSDVAVVCPGVLESTSLSATFL